MFPLWAAFICKLCLNAAKHTCRFLLHRGRCSYVESNFFIDFCFVLPGGPGEPGGPGKNRGDRSFSLVICSGMTALFGNKAILKDVRRKKKKKKWLNNVANAKLAKNCWMNSIFFMLTLYKTYKCLTVQFIYLVFKVVLHAVIHKGLHWRTGKENYTLEGEHKVKLCKNHILAKDESWSSICTTVWAGTQPDGRPGNPSALFSMTRRVSALYAK